MTTTGRAAAASGSDPREWLAASPMSPVQAFVVVVTVCLCGLDGFDVLSISFAAPGIARDWGIDRAALGVVLSMELLGMAAGALALGGIGDRVGRRRMILACIVIMTVGMALAATARGVVDLSVWRVITGIGVGGMLPTLNAVAAEFANAARRDLCVAMMAVGYPLGAIIGGVITAMLLRHNDWHVIFEFGAAVTALFFPLVFIGVPESIAWLCDRQPDGALDRLNRALARIGRPPVAALPARAAARRGGSLGVLFTRGLVDRTLLVTCAYFLHVTTFYFILKWVPKIVVDLGYAQSAAAGVLVWANVGGATGGAVLGLLARRIGLRALTIVLLVASTVMVAVFGRSHAGLAGLSFVCAVAGFCTNGGVVGLYALIARAFPTDVRSTGAGFVLGVGRGGAVLAPAIAGLLFVAGAGLPTVALLMGVGSLGAAVAVALLDLRPRPGETAG
jgi:benzoate transport